ICSPPAMLPSNCAMASWAAYGVSAAVAITALLSTGSSTRLRPHNPIMTSVSNGPNPNPPWPAGTLMPSTPSSAKPAQLALSQPAADALTARNVATQCSALRYRSMLSRSCCCSSLNSKFMDAPLQADDHLGNDVFLNLVGAA